MLVSQNTKTPNQKFALPPTRTPNAIHWIYIGCVGSPGGGAHVGHVHFRLFVSISFALGSKRKCGFSVEYGLVVRVLVDTTVAV